MTDQLKLPISKEPKKRESKIDLDLPGKVATIIGSGKHAQAAVVWHTIRWCFFIGLFLNILVFLIDYGKNESVLIESIKSIWSIFIPVITLAMGYIFGKGKE